LNKYKNFLISDDDSGIRLDRWLRRKFVGIPQSLFQKKLRKGIIRLNGEISPAKKVVYKNDIIEIRDFDNSVYNLEKKFIKLELPKKYIEIFNSSIIFNNNDFMVINKWKGIPTQGGNKILISVDSIIKSMSRNMNLVHRLDKETSGILIISKNYQSTRYFGELFRERKIKKIYIALCTGVPKKNNGTIKLKTKKQSKMKKNIITDSNYGKESLTYYKVFTKKNNFSLIIFIPSTGRMHQIRVLARYLGCPIVGDKKYGKKIYEKNYMKSKETLMLHSIGISFNYNNKINKYIAQIPLEMNNIIKNIGIQIPKKEYFNKLLNF
tara:strand:- start:2 stop:970 length:969 start_codon:yes stop_codon:yes gene_type:complete